MNLELAHRAVACKHWRWMPGMILSLNGLRRHVFRVGIEGIQFDSGWASLLDLQTNPTALPDLDEPSTRGCLLELVRKAWGDSLAVCIPRSYTNWEVRLIPLHGWTHCAWGSSESEALVAALEAAP